MMFTKSKKQKSQNAVPEPKLRGMPALKQMRSSKREEFLSKKSKNAIPSLSDLRQHSEQEKRDKESRRQLIEEMDIKFKVDLIITPNSRKSPSTTTPSGAHPVPLPAKVQYADKNSLGPDIHIYEDVTPPPSKSMTPKSQVADNASPPLDSSWRFSKGDSGYKSQSDSSNSREKEKVKKSKKKSNQVRSKGASGLHVIKQSRKASRENVSQSMRALTPKERESIQFLEEIIKTADGYASPDDVFNSDSEGEGYADDSGRRFCKTIDEDGDETIDYGYASVNDISRRFSVDSMESVGSIIDLVGNLSTSSASSSTPPIYAVVDKTRNNANTSQYDARIANTRHENVITPTDHGNKIFYRKEAIHPEDAITQLDEVINSFCLPSDEEDMYEDEYQDGRVISNGYERNILLEADESDHRQTAGGSCEPMVNSDVTERMKKEKKKRSDAAREKERKEKKKRAKEERKSNLRKDNAGDKTSLREEDIARHVDAITALTRDMILTAQQEPIYAQVDKSRKTKKDINENIEPSIGTIEPPTQFSNGPESSGQSEDQRVDSRNNGQYYEQHISKQSQIMFDSTPSAFDSSSCRNVTTSNRHFPGTPQSHQNDWRIKSSEESNNNDSLVTPYYKCETEEEHRTLMPNPHSEITTVNDADKIGDSNNYKQQNNARRSRTKRPLSWNISTADMSPQSTVTSKLYSSFRMDRIDGTNHDRTSGGKHKPFVLTAMKKPVQLC